MTATLMLMIVMFSFFGMWMALPKKSERDDLDYFRIAMLMFSFMVGLFMDMTFIRASWATGQVLSRLLWGLVTR